MLKTLGKTTWDEIEVGEVFADRTCWIINQKINSVRFMVITQDYNPDDGEQFGNNFHFMFLDKPHKLPLSVQRLWKED